MGCDLIGREEMDGIETGWDGMGYYSKRQDGKGYYGKGRDGNGYYEKGWDGML